MALVDLKGGDLSPLAGSPRFDRFYRTHEKVMWELGALDFKTLRRDLLTPEDIAAVRGAMFVESHNPVYTQRILGYFRGHRDEQEMASFVTTWSYEEMKHYLILRQYLETTGLVDQSELEAQLTVVRSGPWGDMEMGFTRAQSFIYTMMQEQFTGIFYKKFAKFTKEPLLQEILRLIGKDEYRHCQYYLDKCQEELAEDKGRIKEVDEIILGFDMPGPTFIPDFLDTVYNPGMKVAPVDGDTLREASSKLVEVVGKNHLRWLGMTNPSYVRRLHNEFGVSLSDLLYTLK